MATRARDAGRKKHEKTGKPKGGSRPGAGRKPGKGTDGYASAINALTRRLPEDLTPEEREEAKKAAETIKQVMLRPQRYSGERLRAAVLIIDNICGKQADMLKTDQNVLVQVVESKKPEEPTGPLPEPLASSDHDVATKVPLIIGSEQRYKLDIPGGDGTPT